MACSRESDREAERLSDDRDDGGGKGGLDMASPVPESFERSVLDPNVAPAPDIG